MTIWIMDYCTGSVTKFVLTNEREQEIKEKYQGNVVEFLYAHEKEMGINMKYSSFMATNDSGHDVILF